MTDAQSPTAGVTRYAYDTENNLTDIYDASNNHTHFVYTYRHMLQQTTFPSGYYETYTYDSNDNLRSKTDRNGHQTTYTYDYQNRMATKQYADYTSVNYTYDAAGRLTQVADPTGTYTFGFDNMGRLTSAITNYAFTTFGNETVQYGYDAASNRKAMTDPQSLPTTYAYDKLNRLTSLIFNSQTPGFTFAYDGLSRRTSLGRPNSITTTYAYNPQSWLNSVLHKNSAGTVLDGAAYTYDKAGNRLSRTDKRTGAVLKFTYDNLYQLLTAKQGTTTKESYTYDIVGNRLSSLGVSPYTYNSSNELMSLPSGSYTYDKNGNTTVKPDGTQYTWDYENRLTQVVLPSSGGTANFKYDPFGRRIQKAFTQNSITTATNYLYDGPNLLEELDSSGNVLARYTHSSHETEGALIDEPLAEVRSGTTSYYQADVLNTITSLSSAAAALTDTYTYDSFGKLVSFMGSTTNPYRYTGREFDPETGIYEYRARYFDQNVGRFTSEDPLGLKAGINYVRNNPVNFTDPSGLYQLQGFSAAQAAQMTTAINDLVNKLQRNPCCVDPKLRDRILDLLQPGSSGGITFVYRQSLPSDPGYITCARVGGLWAFLTNKIEISDAALNGQCTCPLPGTLLHEATHLTWSNQFGGASEGGAYAAGAACFGSSCAMPPGLTRP